MTVARSRPLVELLRFGIWIVAPGFVMLGLAFVMFALPLPELAAGDDIGARALLLAMAAAAVAAPIERGIARAAERSWDAVHDSYLRRGGSTATLGLLVRAPIDARLTMPPVMLTQGDFLLDTNPRMARTARLVLAGAIATSGLWLLSALAGAVVVRGERAGALAAVGIAASVGLIGWGGVLWRAARRGAHRRPLDAHPDWVGVPSVPLATAAGALAAGLAWSFQPFGGGVRFDALGAMITIVLFAVAERRRLLGSRALLRTEQRTRALGTRLAAGVRAARRALEIVSWLSTALGAAGFAVVIACAGGGADAAVVELAGNLGGLGFGVALMLRGMVLAMWAPEARIELFEGRRVIAHLDRSPKLDARLDLVAPVVLVVAAFVTFALLVAGY